MTGTGQFGWGIIGTGNVVRTLMLPTLAADPNSNLVGFVSGDPRRAEGIAAATGADWWPDLDRMLRDPRVDVVYIASRHDEHARQVGAACAAGRPVLCEKPLATVAEDAEAAVDAAALAGVVLAICHPLRGLPAIEGMRRELKHGGIGQVTAARATYTLPVDFPPDDWHRSGPAAGVLFDITTHTVDTLRYVLGQDVRRTAAAARTQPGWDSPSSIALSLEFEGGAVACTFDSFEVSAMSNGIEIYGEEGALLAPGAIGGLEPATSWTLRQKDMPDRPFNFARPDWLFGETVSRFLSAVAGDDEPLASGVDHLRTLEVVLDATRQVAAGSAS